MRVRRLLPPPPPQATSRSADSSPVRRRMTFWRKQLTAWQRRENLPASRSSVKQETRPPDACRAGATCLRLQVASRPFTSRSVMALPTDRQPRHTARLEGYVYRRLLAESALLASLGVRRAAWVPGFYSVPPLLVGPTPVSAWSPTQQYTPPAPPKCQC